MKKALLIGNSGVGKTTLIQRLMGESLNYRKTQMVEYHQGFIDTPGEYLEHPHYYSALVVTAADADLVGLLHSCDNSDFWLPPAFAASFAQPVFGIVSKADLAASKEDVQFAVDVLKRAGAGRVFVVSAINNTGIKQLYNFISAAPEGVGRH